MFIQTERTRIRPFLPGDINDLSGLCSSAQAMRFIPPHFGAETKQQIADRLQRYISHHEDYGISFGYVSGTDGRFIGRAGFFFVPEVNLYEISYSLLPEYWGQGLATEIAEGLLDYAFHNLNLDKVCARTIDGNFKSDSVLEKTGFTYLGERAFTLDNQLYFWNYYERDNEESLELEGAHRTSTFDEWDFLV